MKHEPKHEAPIPAELREQLEAFRKRLWRIKIAEAILAGVFGLLISFILVFLSDRVWDTPSWLIGTFFVGGTLLFIVFAPYWIHRWVWGHRRGAELARLISRRYPRLGDRLLGIIELQDQSEKATALSAELREAAMRQVAEEASHRNFDQAVPAARHRRWSLGVLACAAIAIAALVLAPQAGLNALKRWLNPFNEVERYTFTKIESLPKELYVPFGEAFELEVRLAEDTEQNPSVASARVGSAEWEEVGLQGRSYRFELPSQEAPQTLKLKVGDLRKDLTVIPRTRPAITEAGARVDYPEYLQREPELLKLRGGVVSVLAGSRVSIQADASADLRGGWLRLPGPDGNASGEVLDMQANENRLVSPYFESELGGMVSFEWEDRFGLRGATPYRLQIESLEDYAPSIYTEGIERTKMILQTETLEFGVVADDDFGLREIGLEWQGEFTKPSPGKPAKGEIRLTGGDPKRLHLDYQAAFSPSAFALAPQKLVLRAYAEDYLPGRGRVYSQPITVYILDKVEHAQMLKNRFERMLGELESDARREQNNLMENQLLEQEEGEDLQKEANRKKIQDAADKESENRERIAELREQMEELFGEANRNDRVEKETLKRLSGLMNKLKELSEKDMREVEKKLRESTNRRNTPEKAKRDLQDGVQKQQKVLEKMREAIKEANEAKDNFEASTFVARLKQAADAEDMVAELFVKGYDERGFGGLLIEEASPSMLDFLNGVNSNQARTAGDIAWIEDDLQNFLKRTEVSAYAEVLKAMKEVDVGERLNQLGGMIQANNGFESIVEARNIAELLRQWAKMIDDSRKQEEGGGGGGGGGRQDNLNDQDFEFMLRVMKMIQKEQDLRARTRAIEQLRRSMKENAINPSES